MSIPVFVISLKQSDDRREHTIKQLENIMVKFSFIDAVDGKSLSDEETRNNPDFGIFKTGFYPRYLRKEEIGCALSHFKVYRKMIDENIKTACIVEDDNDYSADFKDLITDVNLFSEQWDLLYLGHRSIFTTKEALGRKALKLEPLDYYIGEALEVPHGSHGYLIKINAVKKLLSNAFPLRVPFDLFIGNSPALGIRTLLLQPPCVVSNPLFVSSIQDDMTIVISNKLWGTARERLRRNRFLFTFLKTAIIKFRVYLNSISKYLRKKGLIKNNWAKS